MKQIRFLVCALLLLASGRLQAQAVPYCWSDQKPGVVDGAFVIEIPTAGVSSRDLASVFGALHFFGRLEAVSPGFSIVGNQYVANLKELSIQFQAFAEGSARRADLMSSMSSQILKYPGVSIQCIDNSGENPHPGATVSN